MDAEASELTVRACLAEVRIRLRLQAGRLLRCFTCSGKAEPLKSILREP
jgi:hypothetical protein